MPARQSIPAFSRSLTSGLCVANVGVVAAEAKYQQQRLEQNWPIAAEGLSADLSFHDAGFALHIGVEALQILDQRFTANLYVTA